jgi:hypothetical protein
LNRLDRLLGEIPALVSEFELEEGYDNMEIARGLLAAGLNRAGRENSSVYKSYLQFVRDSTVRQLADLDAFSHEVAVQATKGH